MIGDTRFVSFGGCVRGRGGGGGGEVGGKTR